MRSPWTQVLAGSSPVLCIMATKGIKWRRYTHEELAEAASKSTSVAGVCRELGINNPGGSSQTNMRNRLAKMEIDTSHFLGKAARRGSVAPNRLSAAEILVILPPGSYRPEAKKLRRALIEIGRPYRCEWCGNEGIWLTRLAVSHGMSGELVLEIDHIDEDWHNNLPENLRFLCPNCHSLRCR